MKKILSIATLTLTIAGCRGNSENSPETDASVRDTAAQDNAVTQDTATSDAGTSNRISVRGNISQSTTWTADHVYVLEAGPVYVTSNSVLTIQAGTQVRGQVRDSRRFCTGTGATTQTACTLNSECGCAVVSGAERTVAACMTANLAYCGAPTEEGTALIITRGSRLIAEGTAQAPIVFTSDNLGSATAPQAGDWGGVVLLGSAPNNLPNRAAGQIEGLAETNGSGQYGGDDVASSCGTLRFVRIEYAGYRYGTDNELNSLTLGSCGSGTVIEFLQAHRGLDDGIEFFGGSANAKYIVITGTGDDSLDYDQGYSGNVQFYIAQQLRVAGEDRCIEADGNRNGRNNMPYSNPQIYNFTCIGAARPGQARTGLLQDGAIFRDGSAGTLRNSIFVSAPDKGITVQHNETLVRLPAVATPRLLISNNIVTGSGPDGMSRYFDLVSNTSTNRPQNEQMMIDDGLVILAGANRPNVDPGFAGDVYNETAPNFRLTTTGAASQNAAATPTDAFFTAANYLGAVDPANIGTAWYELWTRFGN